MYRLIKDSDDVIREIDGAHIPGDSGNIDRADYNAWVAAGGEPLPAIEPPEPVPSSISDRQFFQQLAIEGRISFAEALSAVRTGHIPDMLKVFINALPQDQQFAVEMLISGATIFERAHPLTVAIGQAQQMTDADINDFFRRAASL